MTTNPAGGTFAGSLDGIPVTGSAAGSVFYQINQPGSGFGSSTINGTSPQYSYANIYDPAAPGVDRVGYSAADGSNAGITITFASPVTNPRFHVANLTGATYTFALAGGLTSVSLVRGNGGGGDGLQVVDNVVSDADPTTGGGLFTTTPPPTTGPRSAFGTISLNGSFTVLNISMRTVGGDGGSFTLSSVPEPAAMAAVGVACVGLLRRRRAS